MQVELLCDSQTLFVVDQSEVFGLLTNEKSLSCVLFANRAVSEGSR